MTITKDIRYIGVNDHQVDLFVFSPLLHLIRLVFMKIAIKQLITNYSITSL